MESVSDDDGRIEAQFMLVKRKRLTISSLLGSYLFPFISAWCENSLAETLVFFFLICFILVHVSIQ